MTTSKLLAAACAVALSASLAGCKKPEPAADPAVAAAKVSATVKRDLALLVDSFNAKSVDQAVSHDADEYVGMFHGAPNVHGPSEDAVVTRQQVSDPNVMLAVKTDAVDVAEAGDMAVVRATYQYTFTDPATKAVRTEVGNWVLGYKKQADGAYRIAWAVVSDTPPPAAPAAPAAAAAPAPK